MKKFLSILLPVVLILVLITFMDGCKKESNDQNNGTANIKISMKSTDLSRSVYDSVLIDIQKVSIHTSADTSENSGWFDLMTNVGVYDLLDYESGNDTIIALDTAIEPQTISQIRLILGDTNRIVTNGESFNLETPSGQTSGIKIQVHAQILPDTAYKVVLEFDPDQSVFETGNGVYKLKPVIKATVIGQ